MRAERFGSYSTVSTRAAMSFLSRLKSMIRYSRLWPPPRHHEVSSPWLLRPPERCRFSVSGRYGWSVVMSSNVCTVLKRVPADVGLNLRIGISVPIANRESRTVNSPFTIHNSRLLRPLQEIRELLAFPQRHVRLLPVRAAAGKPALALHLAVRERGPHVRHLRAEQRFDGA